MPRKMCIMHKFLGIVIKGAHHKGPINKGAALRIETFFKSSCSEKNRLDRTLIVNFRKNFF